MSRNVREYREGNHKRTIATQGTQEEEKQNKTKTKYTMCWTSLCEIKHKQRKQDMISPTNS